MNQMPFDGESLITPKAIADALVSPRARRHDVQFEAGKAELALILGFARQRFERESDTPAIINSVNIDLHTLREKVRPAVWQELIPIAQSHPVLEFFLQDPFTRWSFEKPRGYSGDAHLLDFIYGDPSVA